MVEFVLQAIEWRNQNIARLATTKSIIFHPRDKWQEVWRHCPSWLRLHATIVAFGSSKGHRQLWLALGQWKPWRGWTNLWQKRWLQKSRQAHSQKPRDGVEVGGISLTPHFWQDFWSPLSSWPLLPKHPAWWRGTWIPQKLLFGTELPHIGGDSNDAHAWQCCVICP